MSTTATDRQIEELTQRLGHEMFDRIRGSNPWIFQFEWWEERLLRLFMKNEWLKVQAFRFIDALPTMMDNPIEVARHLREYFVHPDFGGNGHRRHNSQSALAELEGGGRQGLIKFVSKLMDFKRLDALLPRLFSWASCKSAVTMARSFIPGATIQEAERAIRRLRDQRMAFTIDVLGEAAISRAECDVYHNTYLELISELPRRAEGWPRVAQVDLADGQPLPTVNVSVKLTSLHSGIDAIANEAAKAAVKDRLRPLLRKGMEGGAHVHIDIEHYAIKDITLELCYEIFMEDEFRDYPHFGIVLQTYLKDGDRDTIKTIEWARQRGTPIWVRLVKGAYWDTETVLAEQWHWPCPVWEQKWQSDACYERCTRMLLENHEHTHGAFASHNIRSLAHAMALKKLWNVPDQHFELQMLYGMGDPIKRAGVDMEQRCRIYTPYGQLIPGMAYFIRRLLENTANESFLANTSSEEVAHDDLLRNPDEIGRETPPPYETPVIRYEFEEPVMDPFENVPDTDFTRDPNRQEMLSGLAQVRADLGRECPLIIGAEKVTTGQWKDSLNPSRPNEIVARIAQADLATVDRAVEAAAEAFRQWRHVPASQRADHLFQLAELIQQHRFELAALEAIECGKPWREADADVSEAIDFCNYYGKELLRMTENVRRRDIAGETNEYFYAPRGVVAVIGPWNFPLAIPTGMVTAALVTGNTVVLKPAGPAGAIASRLVELAMATGLPPGVLNYVPGPGTAIGKTLVQHPQVALVAFTGSRNVGCQVNKFAAEQPTSQPALKRVIAEMGGKNAIIVDADAELGEAIKGVLASAFGYAGQKCSAASRVVVLEGAYDRFVERLVEAARHMNVGPADEPTTSIPPVIGEHAFNSIRGYIEAARVEARCVLEVDVRRQIEESNGGYYIGPTIFADTPPDARIAREEIFGP
ncbi:MAG: proline dehydrogenase family protein, partial [Planctomycetes bacterium]|nr:proline dehydrogenase family protein [Planctomycetota bacterium]